jgi:hypothetical protein
LFMSFCGPEWQLNSTVSRQTESFTVLCKPQGSATGAPKQHKKVGPD